LRKRPVERRTAVRARTAAIVDDFHGGMDVADTSEARQVGQSVVQGILYRAGRTQGGRIAIKMTSPAKQALLSAIACAAPSLGRSRSRRVNIEGASPWPWQVLHLHIVGHRRDPVEIL